jgi:hypothetical protein
MARLSKPSDEGNFGPAEKERRPTSQGHAALPRIHETSDLLAGTVNL